MSPFMGSRSAWIIPAYAGSTMDPSGIFLALMDHPRIRGEHWLTFLRTSTLAGSSPHTRGARPVRWRPSRS